VMNREIVKSVVWALIVAVLLVWLSLSDPEISPDLIVRS
jgi:hypothetical protein